MGDVRITSIRFKNYKALDNYSLSLKRMNVLVGPNNCGKSTVVGALRVLESCLRVARTKKTEVLQGEMSGMYGYHIPASNFPISLENVHTDYSDEASEVVFRLSNNNYCKLFFPVDGECFFIPSENGQAQYSPTRFVKDFPVRVRVVPVLGPVEHDEGVLDKNYVRSSISTHRASRHFRNIWYHLPDGFEEFKKLLELTWPGMSIEAPRREDTMSDKLTMFCEEERYPRELYWAGFGFQAWCQLLTHISKSKDESIVVVDEPEIYLHPDLQRRLLVVLRDIGADVLLATHSSEIIGDSDASDIVLVNKKRRSGLRLKDAKGVQNALDVLGSIQNVSLARFASNRKILFVESKSDYFYLQEFGKLLGMNSFCTGSVAVFPTGGVGAIERIRALAWGLKELGGDFKLACVFDRDYKPQEQVDSIVGDLSSFVDVFHFHERKEIENYMINIDGLCDSILRAVRGDLLRRVDVYDFVTSALCEIAESMKTHVVAQLVGARIAFFKGTKADPADHTMYVQKFVEERWGDFVLKTSLCPGKEMLKLFRDRVSVRFGVSISDRTIIKLVPSAAVPKDLQTLLSRLDSFSSYSA